MIKLLRCEFLKMRHKYIFLTLLAITAAGLIFSLYGDYSGEFIQTNGWCMMLYQLPLANGIFFPIACLVISSRLADTEHKASSLKQLFTLEKRGRIYDAKLVIGLGMMLLSVMIYWAVILIFGKIIGFYEEPPMGLYLRYLACTAAATAVLYILQHGISMLFKNQAVSFFTGAIGTFVGVFSMFLPQIPLLRQLIPWGFYGALQFMGLYGWTSEERYANAYLEIMPVDLTVYIIIAVYIILFYALGKYLFCRKEI